MRVLEGLQSASRLTGIAPRPILEEEDHERYFVVESQVRGTSLRHLPQGEDDLRLVEDLLRSMNPVKALETGILGDDLFNRLVAAPLDLMLPLISDGEHHRLLFEFFYKAFRGSHFNFGVSHGDFSVRNIYLDHGRVSGVIDWDDGSMRGLPVLDAISHLLSRQSRRGKGFEDSCIRLATREWPLDYELQFLDRCYRYFGVDPGQHIALVMLQWLHVVSNQSQHWFGQDDAFTQQHIGKIAAFISEHQI